MHAADIAGGFPDGTYRPGQPVTRAQMANFLLRMLDLLDARGAAVGAGAGRDVGADEG